MPPTPQPESNERLHGEFKRRLTFRLSVRRRLNASLLAGAAALLLLGTIGHRAAYRSQIAELRRRVDDLADQFQHLPREGGEGGSTPLIKPSAPDNRETAPAVSVQSPSILPPRVLGIGSNGRYRYADVRHSDGNVRRYYLRTNSPPEQVSSWVDTIISNERDARILSAQIPLDNQGAL